MRNLATDLSLGPIAPIRIVNLSNDYAVLVGVPCARESFLWGPAKPMLRCNALTLQGAADIRRKEREFHDNRHLWRCTIHQVRPQARGPVRPHRRSDCGDPD